MQKTLILAALMMMPTASLWSSTASAAGATMQVAAQSKDERLAAEVVKLVRPQAELMGAQVTAVVKQGQAILSGSAPSEEVIRQLVELASTVPGVTQVSSDIEVTPV